MTVRFEQKNPKALDNIVKRIAGAGEVALGWPKGTEAASLAYPDGTPVIEVMFWNNFGAAGIPRRDFMTEGGKRALDATKDLLIQGAKDLNTGKTTRDKILAKAGAVGASEIAQTIVDLKDPPNAPSTIASKGSDNPLVDTGLASQAVTYSVRKAT